MVEEIVEGKMPPDGPPLEAAQVNLSLIGSMRVPRITSSFGIAAVARLTDVQVGSFTSIPPFVEGFSLFNLLC